MLASARPPRKVCVRVCIKLSCLTRWLWDLHVKLSPHTPLGLCFVHLQLSTPSVPWRLPKCEILPLSRDVTWLCFAWRTKINTKWGKGGLGHAVLSCLSCCSFLPHTLRLLVASLTTRPWADEVCKHRIWPSVTSGTGTRGIRSLHADRCRAVTGHGCRIIFCHWFA